MVSKTKSKKLDELGHYAADEVSVSKSDLRGMFFLFRYGRGVYTRLFAAIGLVFVASSVVMLSAKSLGLLVEALLGKAPLPRVAALAGLILGFELLNIILTYYGRVGLAYTTNKIAFNIRCELFNKIARLPISYFDRQPLGRTITRLTNDIEGVEKFFSGPLARVLSAVITIVAVMAAMLMTDLRIGGVLVLASLPAIIFTLALRGPVRHWLRVYKSRNSSLNARLAEYINAFPVIKIFGLEDWSAENFRRYSRDLLQAGLAVMNWNSFIRPASAFFCSLPMVVILWWGGSQVLSGAAEIGMIVAFVRYAERFFWPIMVISHEIHVIQEAIASSERIRQMLGEKEEKDSLGPNGTHRAPIRGGVGFKDVWMEYSPGQPVLRGISFDVKQGMSIGLVGETGSGKTSTINLLPQLYPKLSGSIVIDGKPIEAWDRTAIRQQIGMVSQDIVIFCGSLRENLLVASEANKQMPDHELLSFCHQTGLSQIIDKLPAGLDTAILDGGENLSIGERQLVAFTRMLIRDPAILILDEATSNIDEKCERLIQNAIGKILKGRTCFVIAHRLNTVLQCDHILVFDKGKIVEQGTHEDLMKRQGYYATLAAHQIRQPLMQ